MRPLRALDDRVVPRLAAGLRRLLDARPAVRRPGTPGLVRLLRDVPQLGLLALALVFVVVAVVVLQRDDRQERGPGGDAPVAVEQDAGPTALGPEQGTAVEDYLRRAADRTAELADGSSGTRFLALVSLETAATPSDVGRLLSGLEVKRVYLRAPQAGPDAEVLTAETPADPVGTLTALYARTATAKAEEAREARSLADSIEVVTEEEAAFRDDYLRRAQAAEQESVAYAAGCACVLAALVEAPAGTLAQLAERSGVRGVEPAGRGRSAAELEVRLLLPGTTGVVTEEVLA